VYKPRRFRHPASKTGINMNLAPVLDVNNNPQIQLSTTRSFGSVPLSVAQLGLPISLDCRKSTAFAVAKHFPGWRYERRFTFNAACNPYTIERLFSTEFIPFFHANQGGVEAS
jgi:beta-N-acetylhexosaminidase